MGGILYSTVEQEIIQSLKKDNSKKLKDILIKHSVNPDTLYTKRKRTLIQLSCYFLSPKCLSTLIELNYDYNKKETFNEYTPLYIACKFNCLPNVKILLSHDDCKILQKTTDNFNEFEIAFLKGNYDICYYLLYEYKNDENKESTDNNKENEDDNINNENNIENDINTRSEFKITKKKGNTKLKTEKNILTEQPYQKFFLSKDFDLDNCKSLQDQNLFPLFNMQLLYQSLLDRVPPKKCPSFAAERKRTKELLNKIPDPNETWGHFFKRLVNFELYNPPLVDKKNVSQMNSMYMNAQMKLMESEYGIKMSYYDNDNDIGNLDDSKQVGESEEQPILKLKKNKKIENVEEEPENIIKINVKSVNKTIKSNNENTSVRDKEDFYTVDINNTSGREMNENEKSEDTSDKK